MTTFFYEDGDADLNAFFIVIKVLSTIRFYKLCLIVYSSSDVNIITSDFFGVSICIVYHIQYFYYYN